MPVSSKSARIAGIVLAAGSSRRMGANKLLFEFQGEALVRRTCRRALDAGLYSLTVVVGYESQRIQEALTGLSCILVHNGKFDGAMSESLHKGIECLPADADAAMVMLADMALVTEEMIGGLLAAARTNSAPLLVSRYGATLAPPVVFYRELFPELLASEGEGCGKAVIHRHLHEAVFIDWPAATLADIDTPEDFAAAAARSAVKLSATAK